MADVQIDGDIDARLLRDPGVQSEIKRRAHKVHDLSKRLVHVDPTRDVAKEGPHLRDTIYVRRVGNEWHVGSDKEYAQAEEFGDSPKHGGAHSFLRRALPAAKD